MWLIPMPLTVSETLEIEKIVGVTKNKQQSVEAMIEAVEAIAKSMQNGECNLDESIQSYEKAMRLLQSCQGQLDKAEKSIKILEQNLEGQMEEHPFSEHQKEDGSETVADFTGTASGSSRKQRKKPPESIDNSADDSDSLNLF
jgi:exodeoxyribonuclease VII small subunit